ncbi:MAG: hypothetical protein ACPGN3_10045 [Opitutales bacterium]
MFLLRKLGKLLRGNVTPFQIFSATILGGLLGFSAPPDVAPGIYAVLFVLVLVLNCNLLLFAVGAAGGYILSLLLTPLSLNVGKFFLAGPLSGLFEGIINAPVSAWFGWEYYVFAGALPIAILYGVIFGMAVDRVLHGYRVKMANLEENSERFNKLIKNPLFKLTTFIFIGGFKGKKSFQENVEASKKGLPIRISGAIAVILAIPVGWALLNMFDSTFYTTRIREALEQANEATVDLQSAEVDYAEGRLSLKGLALADPNELSQNRFSSQEITADISISKLLSKRIVVDEVTVDSALVNNTRRVSGSDDIPQKTTEPTRPQETQEPSDAPIIGIPEEITTEEIAEKYESVKDALGEIKEWMEKLEDAQTEEESARKDTDDDRPSWQRRLEEQIAASGMRGAIAEHLIAESPQLTVEQITVRDLRINGTDLGILDIDVAMVSDAPQLLEQATEITLTNRSEQIYAHLVLESLRAPETPSPIELKAANFDIESILDLLPQDIANSIESGKISVQAKGAMTDNQLTLPLDIQLTNLAVQIPHIGLQTFESLDLSGKLEGPIDALSVTVDTQELQKTLQDAAVNAVQDAAKNRLSEEIDKRLGGDDSESGGLKEVLRGFLNP